MTSITTTAEKMLPGVNRKAALESRKARLVALKQEVIGTDSSIEHKVSDIESSFQLKGDKFVELQTHTNTILSHYSRILANIFINEGVIALDREIASVQGEIDSVVISTPSSSAAVKQA